MTAIKLAFVKRYRDRHGKMRFYFRKKGRKCVPLPSRPGSEEFMCAYHRALTIPDEPSPHGIGAGRHSPRSMGALAAEYYQSIEFQNLKLASQRLYRKALDPILVKHGHRSATDLPKDKARKIIQEIGAKTPGMANVTIAVLSAMMNLAMNLGWRDGNPFTGMARYKLKSHHTWTEEQLATYEARWPIGTRERLAFDLLLWTAQRIGDVAAMLVSQLVRDPTGQEMIRMTNESAQEKTRAELYIPIHPALARSLAATPRKGPALIGDEQGRPIQTHSLRLLVMRAAKAAGLPEDCVPHGLRKAALTRLADAGKSAHQIAAVSGHKTLSEVERYTKTANQKRLAMAAIIPMPGQTLN